VTTDALLALLLNVAIPSLLAVAGGLLAARTLPKDKRLEQGLWTALFVGLALIAIGLAFVQQVRITTQQTNADEVANKRQSALEGTNRYTQGQLDSITKVLTSLVSSGSSNNDYKTTLRALLASAATRNVPPVNGPVGLKGLSNAELRDQALKMVTAIRTVEQQYEEEDSRLMNQNRFDPSKDKAYNDSLWSGYTQAMNAVHQREVSRWEPLHVQCGLLITEITSRLPPAEVPVDPEGVVKMTTEYDMLAGAYPLKSLAGYLEKLALLLPQQRPAKQR